MIVRSYGKISWTDRKTGEDKSKHGSLYIHFLDECLKTFDSDTYFAPGETFDFRKITVDDKTVTELNEREKTYLRNLGINI